MIRKITVVGMGSVGKSIALTLAENNCEVAVITRRGLKGFQDLDNLIEKAIENHKTTLAKSDLLSRISWTTDFNNNLGDPDLIIEAIKEDLHEKQWLFKKLDKIYSPEVVLSSVTSSLSITAISKFMGNPERMVGLHFFRPTNVMKLVEIVPGKCTSSKTIEESKIFIEKIGKTPMVVPDTPGFIVNRILFTMIKEAIHVLEEGKVQAVDIDLAMKLGANHPMGPLSLADFIGLDNCLRILGNLYRKTHSPEYKPPQLLIQKVKENNLGRKTGRGFFNY